MARVTLLVAIAALMVRGLRQASAATRHTTWVVVFGAVLAMPASQEFLPPWNPFPAGTLPAAVTPSADGDIPLAAQRHTEAAQPFDRSRSFDHAMVADRPLDAPAPQVAVRRPYVRTLILNLWVVGILLFTAAAIAGRRTIRGIVRTATLSSDPRIAANLESAARALGVRQPLSVRLSYEQVIPFVAGIRRPVIVLPDSALSWSDSRFRTVFLHELAHVRRGDAIVQVLVDVTLALHWCNPLIWWGARRVRAECELACDDLALTTGVPPTDYASELVQLARSLPASRPRAALAFARIGTLETRIRGVLSSDCPRRGSLTTAFALSTLVGLLHLGLAAFSPMSANPSPDQRQGSSSPIDAPGLKVNLHPAPVIGQASPLTPPSMPSEVSQAPSESNGIEDESAVTRTSFTLAAREGACGVGNPDEITFIRNLQPASDACSGGRALLEFEARDGVVVDVHVTLGAPADGAVRSGNESELVRFLLSLSHTLDEHAAARAVQAAALAANGATPAELLGLARDRRVPAAARRMAVTWFDIVAGPGPYGQAALVELARQEGDEPSVREQLLIALGRNGVSVALEMARTSTDPRMRSLALHRAALQLTAAELVQLYPDLTEDSYRRQIVDAVATRRDAAAAQRLLVLINSEPASPTRAASIERLTRDAQ